MKTRTKTVSIVLILLIVVLIGCCAGTKAQQGFFGARIAMFCQLLSPPQDLYKPVAILPISISEISEYGIDFDHVYAGKYDVCMVFPAMKEFDMPDAAIFECELSFELSSASTKSMKKNIDRISIAHISGSGEFYAFWRPNGNGIVLFKYAIPEDFLIAEDIRLKMNVRKTGLKLAEKFGEPTIVIAKASLK